MEKSICDLELENRSNSCLVEEAPICLRQVRQSERVAVKSTPMKKRKTVPVFFASDDNYLPFLTVALSSMKKNASKNYDYRVYVLHSGLNGADAERLMSLSSDTFKVSFVDVSEQLKTIEKHLHLRD